MLKEHVSNHIFSVYRVFHIDTYNSQNINIIIRYYYIIFYKHC